MFYSRIISTRWNASSWLFLQLALFFFVLNYILWGNVFICNYTMGNFKFKFSCFMAYNIHIIFFGLFDMFWLIYHYNVFNRIFNSSHFFYSINSIPSRPFLWIFFFSYLNLSLDLILRNLIVFLDLIFIKNNTKLFWRYIGAPASCLNSCSTDFLHKFVIRSGIIIF